MSAPGAESVERRQRIASLWRDYRARWTLPLVIILIIGLIAVVDHLGSNRISKVDAADTSVLTPTSGGEAVLELDRPWSGLNPNTAAGAASSTATLMAPVLPSAYELNPKLVPQVNSELLLSVEALSTSPLIIQYVINPRAVWSDGVPVTADDFVYAWQSQRGGGVDPSGQPDEISSTLGYRDVASVISSHGGKTVTVRFSTPFTDWRVMFHEMVPAHVARRVGWNHGFDSFDPAVDLSAGPFVLQAASAGQAVLVRNPRWWSAPASVEKVTVDFAPNQAAWFGVLADGNRTVAAPQSFDLATIDRITSMPNTQSAVKQSLGMLVLEFNVSSPVTAVAAARQAIAHAIDRTDLLQRTFGPIDPELTVNQSHLGVPMQAPAYVPAPVAAEYDTRDLDTTDRLLRSLGYHEGPAGRYLGPSGAPLAVRMAVETGDPWTTEVGDQISAQLRAAGITVDVLPVDGPEGLARAAASATYDMALVSRTASPFESTTATWYSGTVGATGTSGSADWSNYDDPAVDQLFIQAAAELNPTAGQAIYGQIDGQLWSQMIALPLFGEPGLVANGVQIANVQYNPSTDGILWNLSGWAALGPGPAGHQT